jgi:hypothetical protein
VASGLGVPVVYSLVTNCKGARKPIVNHDVSTYMDVNHASQSGELRQSEDIK